MALKLSGDEIVERYRAKKTPEMRRDTIREIAAECGVPPSEIAEMLLNAGEQVDGRFAKKRKTLSDPDWKPFTQRGDEAPTKPETIVDPDEPPAPPADGMTVGALWNLLTGVDGEIPVVMSGGLPILGAVLNAVFNAQGERVSSVVSLITAKNGGKT